MGGDAARLSAPRRLTPIMDHVTRRDDFTPDVPIPFSPPLEQVVLPSVERVREACRELLAY